MNSDTHFAQGSPQEKIRDCLGIFHPHFSFSGFQDNLYLPKSSFIIVVPVNHLHNSLVDPFPISTAVKDITWWQLNFNDE